MLKKFLSKLVSLLPQIIASLFLTGFMVYAWTEPTSAPPSGNVASPLNVGDAGQSKSGGLILNTGGAEYGLIVSGFFKIPAVISNPNSSSLWIDADADRSFLNQNAYYSSGWKRFSGSYNSLGLWLDSNNGLILKYASSTAGGSGDNSPVSWTEIMKVGADGNISAGGVNVMPSGMISMFDAACPAGWTRFAALDGRFPQGAAAYGGTGGSANHNHTASVVGGSPSPTAQEGTYNLDSTGLDCSYYDACTVLPQTISTESNLPPYLNVIWCKKN